MIDRLFLSHPRSVNETYGEHARAAAGFGLTLILAGLACLVHGVLPWMYPTTGSRAVKRLHDRMVVHRASTDPCEHGPQAAQ